MFQLKVQQVDDNCLFELSWGQAQRISTIIQYPENLTTDYQEWFRAYCNFYKTLHNQPIESTKRPKLRWRGRLEESGILTISPIDWHSKLVQSQAKLLYQFHNWLRSGELYEIRATIAQAALDLDLVDIFLACAPLEIARLPWETWEIGAEFATRGQIRFARIPLNIRAAAKNSTETQRTKLKVLAIFGDESGLNFQTDRQAVQSLAPLADIRFVGWQNGQSVADLKNEIAGAIADELGWDILFFAGHSNETQITGGEIAIAPGVSLKIQEIAEQLIIAKEKGLRFAIFNSCSGLSIADSLIDLGLSQVAVMREPIHDSVARKFLWHFLKSLFQNRDVHDALLNACQFLKANENLTYPSAYLIPSLFRHPQTELFRIKSPSLKLKLQQWLPTKIEALALSSLLILSLVPQIQDLLLDRRLWFQAIYRDLTEQKGNYSQFAPTLLVQIDEESIQRSSMTDPNPIDRAYLAKTIDRMATLSISTIGIDYILDRQQPSKDKILATSIQQAILTKQRWFVLAVQQNELGEEIGVNLASDIANPYSTLQASINSLPTHVQLLYPEQDCREICPFAYLLTLVSTYERPNTSLKDNNSIKLRQKLLDRINIEKNHQEDLHFLSQLRFHWLTSLSKPIGQLWFRPLLDFSLPPEIIYERIPSWYLLEHQNYQPQTSKKIAILAPGGYEEAGVTRSDNYELPQAIKYWRNRARAGQGNGLETLPKFTGSEAHAWTIFHLLNRELTLAIPDAWTILLFALLGKFLTLQFPHQYIKTYQKQKIIFLYCSTIFIYAAVGWQVYISARILLPWLLPVMTFGLYFLQILPGEKKC